MSKRLLGLVLALAALLLLFVLYAFFRLPLPASGPIQAVFARYAPTPVVEEPLAEPITFQIDQDTSEARYLIEEVQGMMPHTVVGVTDQVAGEFTINPSEPQALEVSPIVINARTFVTDEELRDRAIDNRILFTDRYEYITFTPTAYVGLPQKGWVGESYSFQMIGGLTLLDETHEVTWEVTVQVLSEERLEGSAVATIDYALWGIVVPEMPFIASVGETIQLEVDFTAVAATASSQSASPDGQ